MQPWLPMQSRRGDTTQCSTPAMTPSPRAPSSVVTLPSVVGETYSQKPVSQSWRQLATNVEVPRMLDAGATYPGSFAHGTLQPVCALRSCRHKSSADSPAMNTTALSGDSPQYGSHGSPVARPIGQWRCDRMRLDSRLSTWASPSSPTHVLPASARPGGYCLRFEAPKIPVLSGQRFLE